MTLRKFRIPFLIKFRNKRLKKPCFNVFMNFLPALFERSYYNCFFLRAPSKQHCLTYRDHETTHLTLQYSTEKKAINCFFHRSLCAQYCRVDRVKNTSLNFIQDQKTENRLVSYFDDFLKVICERGYQLLLSQSTPYIVPYNRESMKHLS